MAGQFFVVSGPSGAGKSTIIQQVRTHLGDLRYSISHTTRKPRNNEINDVAYHFIEKPTFEYMIDEGAFVEWAHVYDDLYGTSFAEIFDQAQSGGDVILDLDTIGASNLKQHFHDSVLIYILPPSPEELEKRLRQRGTDAEESIQRRLEQVKQEVHACSRFDYLIINDDLESAIHKVTSIITAERSLTHRMLPHIQDVWGLSGGEQEN